ncbi:hypothetical protein Ancab_003387 [Ancistrocladus abbreviatus]
MGHQVDDLWSWSFRWTRVLSSEESFCCNDFLSLLHSAATVHACNDFWQWGSSSFSWEVWMLFCKWWGIFLAFPLSFDNFLQQVVFGLAGFMGDKPWLLSCFIVLYSIWLHRSNLTFGRSTESKHKIFDRIQSWSFNWAVARLGLKRGSLAPAVVVSSCARKASVLTTSFLSSSPLACTVALVWKGFGGLCHLLACLVSSSNQFAIGGVVLIYRNGGVGSLSVRDIFEGSKDCGLWWLPSPTFSVPLVRVSSLAGQGFLSQLVVLRVDSSEAVAGPGGFSFGYGPDDRVSCWLLGFFGSLCLGWVEVDFDAGRCALPPVWTSLPRDSAVDGCCCCCSTPSSAVVAIVEDGLVVRLALFVDLEVGKFLGRVRSPLN